jgi:hypothetical protein
MNMKGKLIQSGMRQSLKSPPKYHDNAGTTARTIGEHAINTEQILQAVWNAGLGKVNDQQIQ